MALTSARRFSRTASLSTPRGKDPREQGKIKTSPRSVTWPYNTALETWNALRLLCCGRGAAVAPKTIKTEKKKKWGHLSPMLETLNRLQRTKTVLVLFVLPRFLFCGAPVCCMRKALPRRNRAAHRNNKNRLLLVLSLLLLLLLLLHRRPQYNSPKAYGDKRSSQEEGLQHQRTASMSCSLPMPLLVLGAGSITYVRSGLTVSCRLSERT